jgi:SAM-dependent methyltransferase
MERRMIKSLKARLCALLPEKWHPWLQAEERGLHRENLWSLTPISRNYGWERGLPIDRYYIEKFLASHTAVIRGRVLEMGDRNYIRKFGGDRVNRSDVLHYVPGNPEASIVADLTCADGIPGDTFDCIIFTQTLQFIFDFRAALGHLFRILKPGGVLLTTAAGIAKIGRREGVDPWGEYWRFTAQGAQRLFCEFFPPDRVTVATHGNVLAAVAFLHGLATEELRPEELEYRDPDYELLVTVCAVKPGGAGVV